MIAPFGFGTAGPSSKIRWGIIIERMVNMTKDKFLFRKNKIWLAMKLGVPTHQLPGKNLSSRLIKYKNNVYDMMNIHDAMELYNCITGKNEVLIDYREYAKILKERRKKNDKEE